MTIDEIAADIGATTARKAAATLVRKGVLDRVGRGIYAVRPFRAISGAWMQSALVAVSLLLTDQSYYVGGPAALSLHRLTQQVYGSIVDVFIEGHRRARELSNAEIVFHQVFNRDAFDFGLSVVRIEGAEVVVSDPERTLLDLLDSPSLAGGWSAAYSAIREALPRVDLARLVSYGARSPKSSTRQRLGVILERACVDLALLEPLATTVAMTASVPAMIPGESRIGRIHPTWRVVLNDISCRETNRTWNSPS